MGPADERDRGFTLLELLVIVVVIAVLLAIAIPTFLGVRRRANDAAAQTRARQAYVAAKTVLADGSGYAAVTAASVSAAENSVELEPTEGAPASGDKVGWLADDGSGGFIGMVFVTVSKSGRAYYYLEEQSTSATQRVLRGDFETTDTVVASPACVLGIEDLAPDCGGGGTSGGSTTTGSGGAPYPPQCYDRDGNLKDPLPGSCTH